MGLTACRQNERKAQIVRGEGLGEGYCQRGGTSRISDEGDTAGQESPEIGQRRKINGKGLSSLSFKPRRSHGKIKQCPVFLMKAKQGGGIQKGPK